MSTYIPQRVDVIWLDFNPKAGREHAGRRSAFVVSSAVYNGKVGLALVCSVTSRVKGYPFEVLLPAGLAVTGVILSDQLKSLDWRKRRAAFICAAPEAVTVEVQKKIEALLR